ncbi:hypothetical protein ACFQQB_56355 [Nonomuraea rubra]|uniref:hypothetical protein n=1 Tax=Nonomuraea rubra TaxID=46180 RepID=UPI00361FE25A
MILGVALGEAAPTMVAVDDGTATWPVARGAARHASRACVAVDLGGVRTAPVAAIRVGGPCPEALGPVVGSGAATIVRGGHSVTGRRLAPLDTEAVRRFAATCGLVDFAVTATGSPILADHELEVAAIVAAEVPRARITLSYEFGYPGLREREADAIRNAALGPEAGRIADEVARELPGVPAYFARSGGGLVSAHYFRRFPLTCDRGRRRAWRGGGRRSPEVVGGWRSRTGRRCQRRYQRRCRWRFRMGWRPRTGRRSGGRRRTWSGSCSPGGGRSWTGCCGTPGTRRSPGWSVRGRRRARPGSRRSP